MSLGKLTMLVLAIALVGCGQSATDRLPDVAVEPLTGGGSVDLSDLPGPAVVNFWATWCAPCRVEMPEFEAVHQARGDEVGFIGINVGDDAGSAKEFVEQVGTTYPQYLDYDGNAWAGLGATTMPYTVIMDESGNIASRHLGQMTRTDLDSAIDDVLAASD